MAGSFDWYAEYDEDDDTSVAGSTVRRHVGDAIVAADRVKHAAAARCACFAVCALTDSQLKMHCTAADCDFAPIKGFRVVCSLTFVFPLYDREQDCAGIKWAAVWGS